MATLARVTNNTCYAQVVNSTGKKLEIKGIEDVKEILPKLTLKRSNYWGDIKNQRNFLESYAKKFNIRVPEDWGKVKTTHVIENGGNNILSLYKNSLLRTLKFVFPGCSYFTIHNKLKKFRGRRNGLKEHKHMHEGIGQKRQIKDAF